MRASLFLPPLHTDHPLQLTDQCTLATTHRAVSVAASTSGVPNETRDHGTLQQISFP